MRTNEKVRRDFIFTLAPEFKKATHGYLTPRDSHISPLVAARSRLVAAIDIARGGLRGHAPPNFGPYSYFVL